MNQVLYIHVPFLVVAARKWVVFCVLNIKVRIDLCVLKVLVDVVDVLKRRMLEKVDNV